MPLQALGFKKCLATVGSRPYGIPFHYSPDGVIYDIAGPEPLTVVPCQYIQKPHGVSLPALGRMKSQAISRS